MGIRILFEPSSSAAAFRGAKRPSHLLRPASDFSAISTGRSNTLSKSLSRCSSIYHSTGSANYYPHRPATN
jgi:hypothetical protein